MDRYTAVVNKLVGQGLANTIVADGGVAFRLRYVGSSRIASDYADAVLISATSLTLSINGVADSTIVNSGVILFATYTTLGAVIDQVNLSSNWEAEIVAGLRSDAVSGSQVLARSTSTFRPYAEVDFNWDSSVCTRLDVCLESQLPFNYVHNTLQTGVSAHRVQFQRALALQNTSDSSAPILTVYELPPDKSAAVTGKTYTPGILVDNTAFDSGVDAPVISGGYGNSLLVRLSVTGAVWSDTGAYLKVFGNKE